MTDFDSVDYFTDESLVDDPYPYFDHLQATCPVLHQPAPRRRRGDRATRRPTSVWRDNDTFSSCNSVTGPFPALPVPVEGDDISELIDAAPRRAADARAHDRAGPARPHPSAGLLMRLLTPKRLKENEAFMWRLADKQVDEPSADGRCEFINDYAQPFAMLVVADLLGVPEEDHQVFRATSAARAPPGSIGSARGAAAELNAVAWLDDWFREYVEDRRREPREDVLTDLATATYPDGSDPRGDRRRPDRDLPVRRRPGDDGPAARRRAASILAEDAELQDELRGSTASTSPTSSRRRSAWRAR